MQDRTDKNRETLREVERKFHTLMEISADAVVVTDLHGRILQANSMAAAVFGHHRPDDLVGLAGLDLVAPEDRARAEEGIRRAMSGDNHADVSYALVKKDGARFEGEVSSALIEEQDTPKGFIVVFRDTSYRLETEKAVAQYQVWLRSMASDLVLAEERERRRIASELHDRVGQNLALCRLKMSELLESPPREQASVSLGEIADLLDFTIQDVRSLTVELSPPVLYELSFVDAVSWLGDRTRERAGIKVRVVDDGRPKPLSEDVGVFLFKATKELLVNVTKHAGAENILVSLTRANGTITVEVQDDGEGFDAREQEAHLKLSAGFGLFSIRERLTPLGGSIMVDSEPGRGTRVTLTAPLDQREKRQ